MEYSSWCESGLSDTVSAVFVDFSLPNKCIHVLCVCVCVPNNRPVNDIYFLCSQFFFSFVLKKVRKNISGKENLV